MNCPYRGLTASSTPTRWRLCFTIPGRSPAHRANRPMPWPDGDSPRPWSPQSQPRHSRGSGNPRAWPYLEFPVGARPSGRTDQCPGRMLIRREGSAPTGEAITSPAPLQPPPSHRASAAPFFGAFLSCVGLTSKNPFPVWLPATFTAPSQ